MREQNDERRLGHEPLELRERPRPEIAAALPRAWLGIDEDDVARAGLRESRNPDGTCDQRLCENISRRNGIRLAEHQQFADRLADRAAHLVRGDRPQLGKALSVTIVDDDVGGPYSIPPRDVFAKTIIASAVGVPRFPEPGTRHVVLVYAEPRSWKGRGDLGPRSLAQLERLVPEASLVILFAHPRLAAELPGDVPVLCAWHGQALMQRAAARWVAANGG